MPSAMYFCPCNAPMFGWPKEGKKWTCTNNHAFMGVKDPHLSGVECVCTHTGDGFVLDQTYKIRIEFPVQVPSNN